MELFSPQDVKAADPGDGSNPSVDWWPGMPLPWAPDSYLAKRPLAPGYEWRHTVYLWVYKLDDMYECLDHIYRQDEEVYDERPLGQSAAACFVVDDVGRLDGESIVLSSAAWGLGQALQSTRRSDSWFDGFERANAAFATQVREAAGLDTDDPGATGIVITPELLVTFGTLARAVTGLPKKHAFRSSAVPAVELENREPLPVDTFARIRSYAVMRDSESNGSDFLNSLILDDLGKVTEAVASGTASRALLDYLDSALGVMPTDRTDTVATPGAAYPQLSPGALPLRRWPSHPHHSLATSQQLAVDLSLADLTGGRALRSVNGPPGTGKMTLLRDVVAGLVVERARVLAALSHPGQGFSGEKITWKVGDYTRVLHCLNPALTGFEMVVASANNKAVQNVSDELPDADAVKAPWSEADYLRDIATQVRRAIDHDDEAEAWGMIAARLGRAANRRAFADAFWTNKKDWASAPGTFRYFLEEADQNDTPRDSWAEASKAFTRAVGRVEELTREARDAEARLARQHAVAKDVAQVATEITTLVRGEAEATTWYQSAATALTAAEADHERARAMHAEHQAMRPGWWAALVTFGEAGREWRAADAPLAAEAKAAAAIRNTAHGVANQAREDLTTLRRGLAAAQDKQTGLLQAKKRLDTECRADRERWGEAYPDPGWFRDVYRRELAAPWTEAVLNEARTNAFLAALDLHAEWFRQCARRLIPSMRAAMDVVRGSVPKNFDSGDALAAWQVFFMVVPLVSTTFASLGRMFTHLGRESLGWLFIDEAGQAPPQAAVGGLWRAQHALVVGDPLQLTPIITLPTQAEANIAREHRVPQVALPSQASVQRVADGANPWGTYLGDGDDLLWVGTPLRVHRRCDDPMFTVSNTVAYGGLMLHGIPADQREVSPLPDSAWLHVAAVPGGGHALRADLAVAERLVRDLLDGVPGSDAPPVAADQIIVISPFRAMANAVGRFPQRLGAPVRAGTVHTAQGQEADVVVFVLGGDPKKPGARQWAATTPNLVNVAASRAKKRLYVIGDHHAWAALPHFSTLAAHLPRRAVTPETLW